MVIMFYANMSNDQVYMQVGHSRFEHSAAASIMLFEMAGSVSILPSGLTWDGAKSCFLIFPVCDVAKQSSPNI